MDEILAEFLDEAEEALAALGRSIGNLSADPAGAGAACYRSVHLLRGASGFLGLPRVGRLAAAGEMLFSRLSSGAAAPTPDRVEAARRLHGALEALVATVRREGREPPGDDGPLVELVERAAGDG